ncbi:MAG TPA: hypothetical protein VHW69_10015 [Rhizomicrobium sp.]|nr:hypothetical protein [Rhizomicrobium sp.]
MTSKLAIFTTALLLSSAAAQANIAISSEPTHDMECDAGVCTPTAKEAVLNVDDLTSMLASGDVTVQGGDGIATAAGLEIDHSFRWSSKSRLTLSMGNNIIVNAPVTVAGSGALTLTYAQIKPDDDVLFRKKGKIQFRHMSSSLIIQGNSYVLANTLSSLSTAIAANPQGFFALASDYDAGQDGQYRAAPIYSIGEGHSSSGVLSGLGNTIQNLSVVTGAKHTSVSMIHLNYGVVRDVNLTNVDMRALRGVSQNAGGLLDYNLYAVKHCFTSGNVGGEGFYNGGLVALNLGTIVASHSAATVSGIYAGGLVGINRGVVSQSFATGSVQKVRGTRFVGGLVGENDHKIIDSYSTASVSARRTAGGLIGLTDSKSRVSTSYSIGPVAGGYSGGFIGGDETPDHPADYWDIDTSGASNGCGGGGSCKGVTGLTDAQLKSSLPAKFDPEIWGQSPKINNGYPYLLANPPPK